MKQEIHVALQLLAAFIRRFGSFEDETLEQFRLQLENVLLERYQGHWYTDKPIKGQAYRSLDFNKENDYCDPIVNQVCRDLNISSNLLGIQHELTLWIDPYEVSIRLGSHVFPKDNQHFIVAQFNRDGKQLFHHDLDALLSQARLSIVNISRVSPSQTPSPCESTSCSSVSTPQRTSSPCSNLQASMYHNAALFTPPRALSPQAPVFQMSSPINVPLKSHPLENSLDSTDEGSSVEDNRHQPDRSDTPHSMHSTTSNDSTDSGYCGYVESYPYYYKLNRLNKALALQKYNGNRQAPVKVPHTRRISRANYQDQQESMVHSTSPTTPTPMNIDRLAPFYTPSPYFPMPATMLKSGKLLY